MAKVPKAIKEATKTLDRTRFELTRRSKHWAIAEKKTGIIVMTLHGNYSKPGGRAGKNQLADMRRAGLLV